MRETLTFRVLLKFTLIEPPPFQNPGLAPNTTCNTLLYTNVIVECFFTCITDVGAEYFGNPLMKGPWFSGHGLHATLLEIHIPLTNGTVAGFSFYTHSAVDGLDIPAIRLQIFEVTMGQMLPLNAKLVLEKRIVLTKEDLDKNHTASIHKISFSSNG